VLVFLVLTQIPGALLASGILIIQILRDPVESQELTQLGIRGYMAAGRATTALLVGLGCAQIFSWILGLAISKKILGPSWKEKVGWVPTNLKGALSGLGLGVGIFFLAEGLVHLIRGLIPHVAGESELKGILAPWPWWLAVLIIGLGPGIGEELWCRGFLGHGLVSRLGTVRGVLLTSLLFGLMHIDPAQATYAAALGVILHLLRLGTGSLLPPMIAHTFNNSVSMLGVCKDSPVRPHLEALDTLVSGMPWAALLLGLVLCSIVLIPFLPVSTPRKETNR